MFKSAMIRILAICLLFAPAQAFAESTKGHVIWRITDWPPFYVLHGPLVGQGLWDKMIAEFQKSLPQVEHSKIVMTTQRALQQMKDGQMGIAVCHVSMLEQSITGYAYVSKVNSILLPHVIFATPEVAARIVAKHGDAEGFVSIEQVVQSQEFRGALANFGTHDVLLKYYYATPQMPHLTQTAEDYTTLARLLVNGRVDYIVQYEPFRITLMEYGMAPENIGIIKIRETKGRFVPVFAGCTRNELGQMVIDEINKVLDRNPETLRSARLQWLSEEHKQELVEIYNRVAPELLISK